MKKGLRLVPLTAAFVLAVSGFAGAAGTPKTVYYETAKDDWVKSVDYVTDKGAVQEAQVKGLGIYVIDENDEYIDWAAAIRSNKNYSDAEHSEAAVTAIEKIEEIIDGKPAPEEPGDKVKTANAKVAFNEMFPSLKEITLNSTDLAGATHFQVEGNKNVAAIGEYLQVATSEEVLKITLLDSEGNVVGTGNLTVNEAATLDFDIKPTEDTEKPGETDPGEGNGQQPGEVVESVAKVAFNEMFPSLKEITLKSTNVDGATHFKVEGNKNSAAVGDYLQVATSSENLKVELFDKDGKLVAEGSLAVNVAGDVSFEVTTK